MGGVAFCQQQPSSCSAAAVAVVGGTDGGGVGASEGGRAEMGEAFAAPGPAASYAPPGRKGSSGPVPCHDYDGKTSLSYDLRPLCRAHHYRREEREREIRVCGIWACVYMWY